MPSFLPSYCVNIPPLLPGWVPNTGFTTCRALMESKGQERATLGTQGANTLHAPPSPARLGSQGTETSSRLGWARRAWTHRGTQRLPCCFAKHSHLWSGREGPGQLAPPFPSSWAGPGARLDFSLFVGHCQNPEGLTLTC